jgi:GDP-L-fucose synthase
VILVLGATGFLGKRVCRKLDQRGLSYHRTSLSLGVDLRDRQATRDLLAQVKPEAIINCAAYVGGIHFGLKHPVELFDNNLAMTMNILAAAQEFGVKRTVNPISNCAYPAQARLFKEAEFWDGALHESVLVYGFVRKASWVGSWAYAQQYGLDVVNLVLSNMYGPEDHFEPERSHALGALIMRFAEARRTNAPSLAVWGTGTPVREWLHVDDGAEALVRALEAPRTIEPVNVGIGHGLSIAELAKVIAVAVGYEGEIVFDTSKPDGAPYKTVDGSNGVRLLNWQPSIPLDQGIADTVQWYLDSDIYRGNTE